MIESSRLVLHVGPPRTGTTSLQFGAFARHPQIISLGKPFDVPGAPYPVCQAIADLCDSLWKEDGLAFDFEAARQRLEQAMFERPWPPSAKVAVLSEEGFGHAGVVDPQIIAKRLRRVFGCCRVLVTTRNPVDAVASYHGWAYARGFVSEEVDVWVQRLVEPSAYYGRPCDHPLQNARYGALVRQYVRLFGRASVCVLDLDLLRNDPKAYADRLGCFLGVDVDGLAPLLSLPAENRRVGRMEALLQRVIKRGQAVRRRWQPEANSLPPSRLVDLARRPGIGGFLRRFDRPARPMSDQTRRWLTDYYAADQAVLNVFKTDHA